MRVDTGLTPRWFQPFEDQPEKFHIRPLKLSEKIDLTHALADARSVSRVSGEQQVRFLKAGLLGWEGIEDANGTPVPFSADVLDVLTPDYAGALVNEIFMISVLPSGAKDAEESPLGNSESQSK